MKTYSVAEIIALKLPMLPTTRPSILAKAKREGWITHESIGQGGVRLLFEVPAYYFNDGKDGEKMTLHDAKQAASKAFEAAQIAGVTDKEKFVSMFELFCNTHREEQAPSTSHNARHKVKAKDGMVVSGAQTAGGNITNVKTIKGDFNK